MTRTLPELPPTLVQDLQKRLAGHNTHRMFGFELEDIRLGSAVVRMPYREEITNGVRSRGTIHGGILAVLADTAAAFALASCLDGHMSFATVDLHITYLARAQSTTRALARLVRKGKRINVCAVDILNDTEELVATATVNFILTKPVTPH